MKSKKDNYMYRARARYIAMDNG